ncbi:MAG: hypothetical protein PHR96_00800 [Clostridia bacterium]|nr:hypothetical protein [Clostridia bacterium]
MPLIGLVDFSNLSTLIRLVEAGHCLFRQCRQRLKALHGIFSKSRPLPLFYSSV